LYFSGITDFNCSVDVPDVKKSNHAEDLSINDMESIIEIVFEKFLGFDNSVKEFDDSDQDSFQFKKGLDLYVKPSIQIASIKPFILIEKQIKITSNFFDIKSQNQDISTPPPRQLFS
jgi:hypothetical protein